jgi:hypothetical protein
MMRFAAGFFSYAVRREPVLKTTAYILVLIIAVELLLEEFAGLRINDWLRFAISISAILLSLAYAHSRLLQTFRPVLVWLARGFSNFNEVFDWALEPFYALAHLIQQLIQGAFKKAQSVEPGAVQENAPTHRSGFTRE